MVSGVTVFLNQDSQEGVAAKKSRINARAFKKHGNYHEYLNIANKRCLQWTVDSQLSEAIWPLFSASLL